MSRPEDRFDEICSNRSSHPDNPGVQKIAALLVIAETIEQNSLKILIALEGIRAACLLCADGIEKLKAVRAPADLSTICSRCRKVTESLYFGPGYGEGVCMNCLKLTPGKRF